MDRPPPRLPRWPMLSTGRHATSGTPGCPEGGMVCYLTYGREVKTGRLLAAWAAGVGAGVGFSYSEAPLEVAHHVVWGQLWTAERLIPAARLSGGHIWHLDNGWFGSARGGASGHYRVTLDGPCPRLIPGASPDRVQALGIELAPWRQDGRHVVLALPGPSFGRAWGLDMEGWIAAAEGRLRAVTSRPIIVRPKDCPRPLAEDLSGAWALVTHSSNAAVDAVLAGIPAICEGTSPTAPLGNVGLGSLRCPDTPDRGAWLRSLVYQQWTIPELRSGEAWASLRHLYGGPAPAC